MNLYLTEPSGEENLTDETVIRYYYKKNNSGIWDSENDELKNLLNKIIKKDGNYIHEHVPRAAIEYMQIDKYYNIVKDDSSGVVPTDVNVQEEEELKELRDVVYYGAKNARLSSEEFGIDPLESAERGVLFLMDFAIDHG